MMKQLNDSLWGRGIILIFWTIFFCAIITGVSMGVSSVFAGDVDAGKKVFRKCNVCHTLEEGGKKKIGPNLFGIMGRQSGTFEGFKYSKARKTAAVTWNVDTLTQYLSNPKAFIPGNKMAFPGIKKPEQIENVITYIIEKSK